MGANACDDVFSWADRDPGRVMFAVQADGAWQPVSAARFAGRVSAVAAGLVAAGIRPGDRVGLMAAPSLDWVVCDFAIWAAGAAAAKTSSGALQPLGLLRRVPSYVSTSTQTAGRTSRLNDRV